MDSGSSTSLTFRMIEVGTKMHINRFSQIYTKRVTIHVPYKPSSIFCGLEYTSFSFFPILTKTQKLGRIDRG